MAGAWPLGIEARRRHQIRPSIGVLTLLQVIAQQGVGTAARKGDRRKGWRLPEAAAVRQSHRAGPTDDDDLDRKLLSKVRHGLHDTLVEIENRTRLNFATQAHGIDDDRAALDSGGNRTGSSMSTDATGICPLVAFNAAIRQSQKPKRLHSSTLAASEPGSLVRYCNIAKYNYLSEHEHRYQ